CPRGSVAPAGLDRHLRGADAARRGVPLRELDRLRGPGAGADGLPPSAAARRPHPALAPALRPGRVLPDPPRPPHPPRPDPLTGSGLTFRHLSAEGLSSVPRKCRNVRPDPKLGFTS